jgi:hypothetical protein
MLYVYIVVHVVQNALCTFIPFHRFVDQVPLHNCMKSYYIVT